MRKGEANVIFAIPNSVTKSEFELLASTYALPITEKDVVWTRNQEETEVLLKVGSVQAGIVNKLEETLSLTEFELLKDDKNVFVMSQSALTLNRDLLIRYPEIGIIETKLRTLLTTEKMQALVRRVRLLDYSPTEVAMELLLREGLIIR
jgi:glycine betaine/choline ABC-type transport system substrate-binding protein